MSKKRYVRDVPSSIEFVEKDGTTTKVHTQWYESLESLYIVGYSEGRVASQGGTMPARWKKDAARIQANCEADGRDFKSFGTTDYVCEDGSWRKL